MKRLLYLLAAIGFAMQFSPVMNAESFTLTFSENDFQIYATLDGALVIEPNGLLCSYPENNDPGLPLISADYAIAAPLNYTSSNVTYTKRLVRSNVDIAESPKPVPTSQIVAPVHNAVAICDRPKYPESNCQYVTTSSWGDVSVLHFLACPFEYDAIGRNLYFIDSMTVSIATDSKAMSARRTTSRANYDILKSFVINPEALPVGSQSAARSSSNYSSNRTLDYVIITKEELREAFEPLKAWKRQKGVFSEIITMEEIETSYEGNTPQLKLKNCLYDLYQTRGLTYALLGGDDTVVPVMNCYVMVGDTVSPDMPTDLYYATFGGEFDWDKNNDGVYGDVVDNIDMTPSIYITRAPVRSIDDTNAFVVKLLTYEKSPTWNNNFLMFGKQLKGDVEGAKSDASLQLDNMYENFIKPYWTGKRTKFTDTDTIVEDGISYLPTCDNLSKQIAKGYSFVSMVTHGSQRRWQVVGGSFPYTQALEQENTASTIITTIACCTNAFDSAYKRWDHDPSVSESFIRNPNSGVIAFLGCSREGWISVKSSYLGPSSQYEALFYENLFSSTFKNKNFGIISAAAKVAMISRCSNKGPYRWVQFGLNPVGDPEMPVYTSYPRPFTKLQISDTEDGITIQTGVVDCRICVMSFDDCGESYYKVFDDVSDITITDAPLRCSICVSKQNYIPKTYTIGRIQNETLTGIHSYECDIMKIGSAVASSVPVGPAIIEGGKVFINATKTILAPGTQVKRGAILQITPKKQ